jgi:hypothetical protein
MRYRLDKRHNGTVRGYETKELLDGKPVVISKGGRPITGQFYGVRHPRISLKEWERAEFCTLRAAKEYVSELFREAR